MDLPKRVLVGNGVIQELGGFLDNLGISGKVHIVSGSRVIRKIKEDVEDTLQSNGFMFEWSKIERADIETVENVKLLILEKADIVVGIGGGKTVDVAKLAAYNAGLKFISIPTSASHDGISSPFASIKGLGKPFSFVAHSPLGIIADLDIISKAPYRLLASGCGDLVGKITAIKDWEIAKEDIGEYFGKYSASLAYLSAEIILKEAKEIGLRNKENVRNVIEALISAGVAAGIAGSSRPCSGSEHLFAHSLDIIENNTALHGEKVAIGTILMSKLQENNWESITEALKYLHLPINNKQLGIDKKVIIKAILHSNKIRPDRYTVLNRVKMDQEKAINLARSANII